MMGRLVLVGHHFSFGLIRMFALRMRMAVDGLSSLGVGQ